MNLHLVSAALLAAFATSASAQSSLTLYGLADGGLQVIDSHLDGVDSTVGLASSQAGHSRFGLKGSAALGGGVTVEFQLENGFNLDTGRSGQDSVELMTHTQSSRLFGREARLGLVTPWGSIDIGRFGSLGSGTGSVAMLTGLDPFGTGYLDAGAQATQAFTSLRVDNAVAIKTPVMAGLQLGAMASLAMEGQELAGGRSENFTFYGVATTYARGPLWIGASYEAIKWPSAITGDEFERSSVFKIGANLDLGPVQPYVSYVKTRSLIAYGSDFWGSMFDPGLGAAGVEEGANSTAWLLGARVPLAGGTLMASYQRLDAERVWVSEQNYGRDVFALGYDYPLSKRTSVYGVASVSIGRDEFDRNHYDPVTSDPTLVAGLGAINRSVAQLGIKHRF